MAKQKPDDNRPNITISGGQGSNYVIGSEVHGDVINRSSNTTPPFDGDLAALAKALVTLRDAMKAEATDAAHYQALAEVAQAEEAARASNRPKVLDHLKAAGEWALSVATKVGVRAAVEAIKTALGGK